MSEFVECQNCGRKFFAENIECPYCRGGETESERFDSRPGTGAGGLFGVLFNTFMVVLAGVAILSLVSLRGAPTTLARAYHGFECVTSFATLLGLARHRRWGRVLAIAFILANAVLGVGSLVAGGRSGALAWGPGPVAMLLFLLPFFSPQARARYSR